MADVAVAVAVVDETGYIPCKAEEEGVVSILPCVVSMILHEKGACGNADVV
jgi:hypothetical protein